MYLELYIYIYSVTDNHHHYDNNNRVKRVLNDDSNTQECESEGRDATNVNWVQVSDWRVTVT
jgi:hypothetical protein